MRRARKCTTCSAKWDKLFRLAIKRACINSANTYRIWGEGDLPRYLKETRCMVNLLRDTTLAYDMARATWPFPWRPETIALARLGIRMCFRDLRAKGFLPWQELRKEV